MRFFYFLIFIIYSFACKTYSLETTGAFGQFSSITSQVPPASGNALIQLDSLDTGVNITLSADKQSVVIKEEGYYFIMTNANVGSIDQTTTGYVDVWLVSNKKPLPNTGCRATIDKPETVSVVISQGIIHLKAGDRVGTGFAASGPSLGIIFTQPDNEPAISSLIFCVFKM
jgi:hypothetical protein